MKRLAGAILLAAAGVLLGVGCRGKAGPPPEPLPLRILIKTFAIPTAGSHPKGIAAGPDGAMWFAERGADRIGRISVQRPFAIEEFALPQKKSEPWAVAGGSGDAIWFTESGGNRIGRISTRPPHAITELDVPTSDSWARSIAAGPDGAWFVGSRSSRIGRILESAPDHVEEYALPRFPTPATSLTLGPDGNAWFTTAGDSIGRALAAYPEAILEFPLRGKNTYPGPIASGPDGNVWFGTGSTGTVARFQISEPHAITELKIPGKSGAVSAICSTAGFVWVARTGLHAILRIDAAAPYRIREVPLPPEAGAVEGLAAGPDGNVWFTAGDRIGVLVAWTLGRAGDVTAANLGQPATLEAEYQPGPAPVPQGDLDIRTVADCTIFLDGVEIFRLTPANGNVVSASAGKHLVAAVARESGVRVEKEVEVFSGRRAGVIFETFPSANAAATGGAGSPAASRPGQPRGGEDPRVEFVRIPAGEFVMGSASGNAEERPPHKVRITRPFDMAKYELTQKQWQAVMGPFEVDQSTGQWTVQKPRIIRYGDLGDAKPVIGVSWQDAQEFLAALNRIGGGRYRLPTEAEWEYACRAGTGQDFEADMDAAAWTKENFGLEMHPVGKKRPNAWGLYDMHGNAPEHVADWYDPDYYRRSPTDDPPGPTSGSTRILRGGDAWNPASNAGCANRHRGGSMPLDRAFPTTIRLVRDTR